MVPDVSAILVNYNTGHLLEQALGCLRAAATGLSVQTILVDNASKDGSVALIRRRLSDCELLLNQVNVGFGRANNQALAGATGRYVLLLNTDAFVAPDTLRKTVEYMDAHPRCGILGVKLLGRDGTLQPSARYFPTPLNRFVARAGLARWLRGVRMVDDMAWDHASVRRCDWVPGCYYLVRRQVIEQIGLFDPRYFLYYEEVDHCLAAKRAGWDVVFFPHTSVVHIGGESARSVGELTAGGRQIEVLQIESELLFFRKNYGLAAMLAGAALYLLADLIVVVKRLLSGRRPAGLASGWRHAVLIWSALKQTRLGAQPTR